MIKAFFIAAAIILVLFFSLDRLFPVPDNVSYSTIITGNKNEILHGFLTPDQKWRMKTGLDEISPLLRKTLIHKEDKYFYYHLGINPFAFARAAANNIFQGRRTSGASTITMQVARALEKRSRTYPNKLVEIFRALQLEIKYNKDEILQLYCNLLPYGGNIEGVKAAAMLYFGKDPDHLSLAEITALSIVPNRPSSLVPGKNNESIMEARNLWLKRFASEKLFTEKETSDALSEGLTASRGEMPKWVPHLAVGLHKNPSPLIRTTIDLSMQMKMESIVKDYMRPLKRKNIHNAAVLIIDNFTGKILSYIGSADFTDSSDGGQVDGVTAIRQPGSTLKPLVYGMCIDEGLMTPKQVLTDVAVNFAGYAPENFDKKFNGMVTMEYALGHSLNIPAVKSLSDLGTQKLIGTLASCDFMQVKKDAGKLGLSLILGGCGATLLELTGMYAAFANGGHYSKPSVLAGPATGKAIQIVSEAATFMINETLSEIHRPDFPLNWQSTQHMPRIAWKTGTSYGRRDAWSIGYNKRYTAGVWVGNFSGAGVPELSGADIATPLLFRIFNTIDYDSDHDWFQKPGDCDIRTVCSETGMPPGDHCPDRITDYFIPMVSPTAVCNNQQETMVSADGNMSYCKTCVPATGYRKTIYKLISPEMQAWYSTQGIAYENIPVHNPHCEQVFHNDQPHITSPRSGFEYLVSRKEPEPLQLQCRTGNDTRRVYWYIDDHFYKSAEAGASVYFVPQEGPVKISCSDDKGRNRDIWIRVKYVDL